MAETVELEIGLRRHGDQHAVELRCSSPDSQTEVRSGSSLVQFDSGVLRQLVSDDGGYGTYLTENLFAGWSGEQGQSDLQRS